MQLWWASSLQAVYAIYDGVFVLELSTVCHWRENETVKLKIISYRSEDLLVLDKSYYYIWVIRSLLDSFHRNYKLNFSSSQISIIQEGIDIIEHGYKIEKRIDIFKNRFSNWAIRRNEGKS